MTTLSIEDLKAWLELLPKLPAGPWGWRGKSSSLHTVGGLWPYGETVLAPTWDYDEGAGIEKAEGVSEHLEKCDPATIAALIEGYIAKAEALPALRNKIASEADQYNPPPILADDRSDYMAGVQAATHQAQCDFVFELDRILSALNIGGTND